MNSTSIRTILFPAASLVFWIALSAPLAAQDMTSEQIRNEIIGKCMQYWGPTEGTQCYRKNGRVQYDDKQDGRDRGNWVIDKNRLCVKYSKAPKTYCAVIKKIGDNKYTDGSYSWRMLN